jgi:cytochrome d ubiquinol oxidase subunit II
MLATYAVLEGASIGTGMLQYVVGKTDAERRMVIAAIGPLWSWNEVWLVSFGATLFMAFPTVFAASFAGFYLAFFLVLWALIVRGMAIEVSGHLDDPMWRTAWHVAFVAANIVLAILIGAALGNLARGVPLGADGKCSMAFFTHFGVRGDVGILDWYTISLAIFFAATFAAHGATALVLKTEGVLNSRSLALAQRLWMLVPALAILVSVETWFVRSDLLSGMVHQPIAWLGLLMSLAGLGTVWTGLRFRREPQAAIGSSAFIAGLIAAGSAGSFPVMLRSTLGDNYSLTAYQSAAGGYGLAVAAVWWPLALTLSIGYFAFVYWHYRGKVKPPYSAASPY